MDGCMEARAAITIGETPCPRCGESVETFVKDGTLAADAVCDACGCVIPAGQSPGKAAFPATPPPGGAAPGR